MTEKEIYKARAEGLNRVAELHQEVSDSSFLEFMSYVREVAIQYKQNPDTIQQEILEKSEIRKKLNQLFQNEPV